MRLNQRGRGAGPVAIVVVNAERVRDEVTRDTGWTTRVTLSVSSFCIRSCPDITSHFDLHGLLYLRFVLFT